MFFERFIACRYLRSQKGTGFAYVVTWFSLIGIALGVATLIIVTSVMNGFREELLTRIVGMKGHVIVSKMDTTPVHEYEKLAREIKKSSKDIEQVFPVIERQAILIRGGISRGVMIHALSSQSLQNKTLLARNIVLGRLSNFKGDNLFIGQRMAESAGLKLGDEVSILYPDGIKTPFGTFPKQKTFSIAGIFEVGMNDYDKNIILMPLLTAQNFFEIRNAVDHFEVLLDDISSSNEAKVDILQNVHDNINVLDWQHSDANIFHAVKVEKNVMTLILSIIVLVAVFNIISGLTMLTNSKTRDIAILRTIGVPRRSVTKIFFTIGASIGIVGTGSGVLLGLLVTLNIDRIKKFLEIFSESSLFSEEIYFLSQIPSKVEPMEVLSIVAGSLILCFMATIYPARKAASLDPVEALRF